MQRRAIFFDRDGTLCEKKGALTDARQLRLLPDAAAAVRRLNHGGWQVIVVTEQPGLAFDEFDEDLLAEIHEQMRALLLDEGARLDAIYHCPHHPEGRVERYRRSCACRRPGVALFERARDEMGIDLRDSFFVGGNADGLRAAVACGIRAILLRSGEDQETAAALPRLGRTPVHVVDSIEAAAKWALQCPATSGIPAS